MIRFGRAAALTLTCLAIVPAAAFAYDGDWKRGRVYYKGVCTSCHAEQKGAPIPPNAYTMAEWKAYLEAGKHAAGKDMVKQYVSTAYRDSIKASNKVAEKFADAPGDELFEDIRAFVVNGAKDGDAPASCN
jgi:mono/diheme cytochrome c family protein